MSKTNSKYKLLILLGAILWGTTGSAQQLAPSGLSSQTIGTLRILLGGLALILLSFMNGEMKNLKKMNFNKRLLIIAIISMAAYQPFFFTGVKMTGIAFGTLIGIGSSPIFSGLIDITLGHRLSKKWIVANIVSLSGCIILFIGKSSFDINVIGVVFSMAAGLSYSVFVHSTKNLYQDGRRIVINGLIFTIGGILLIPTMYGQNISPIFTGRGILVILHLCLITVTLAYSLFALGIKHVSSSESVTLTLAEPLTASLLGIFAFRESVTLISVIGIIILFIGLLINGVPDKHDNLLSNLSKAIC
jgi:DME family drug/metabolite transporter